MNATTHHRGIAGLEGREPVGVVLSVGRKNERGFPVENDRFHLVVPREENGKRPGHSAFAAFNGAPWRLVQGYGIGTCIWFGAGWTAAAWMVAAFCFEAAFIQAEKLRAEKAGEVAR